MRRDRGFKGEELVSIGRMPKCVIGDAFLDLVVEDGDIRFVGCMLQGMPERALLGEQYREG